MLCRNEIEYTVFDLSTQKTGYRWIISINEQAFMATINDRIIFANATRSFHLIINSAVTNDVYQTIRRLLSFHMIIWNISITKKKKLRLLKFIV